VEEMFPRKIKIILTTIFVISFLSQPVYGQIRGPGGFMASPLGNLKKTVVFLGRINPDGKPRLFATGFLVNVQNVYHLITAKHVVVNPATGKMQDENLLAFFNLKGGGVTVRSISDMKKEFGVNWIFHSDPKVDVAMIPFLINPAEDDVLVISDSLFLSAKDLFELYDIFFLSYQPGIEPKGRIMPVIRTGVISLLNDDGTFYIDAAVFPGNTGSPVCLKPSAIRFGRVGGRTVDRDPLGGRFVGIIGEYIAFQELAVSVQTGRPRVMFEENTGLSKVWSVGFINEIISSEAFKQQLKKMEGR
jgi:hypothetical protein